MDPVRGGRLRTSHYLYDFRGNNIYVNKVPFYLSNAMTPELSKYLIISRRVFVIYKDRD